MRMGKCNILQASPFSEGYAWRLFALIPQHQQLQKEECASTLLSGEKLRRPDAAKKPPGRRVEQNFPNHEATQRDPMPNTEK